MISSNGRKGLLGLYFLHRDCLLFIRIYLYTFSNSRHGHNFIGTTHNNNNLHGNAQSREAIPWSVPFSAKFMVSWGPSPENMSTIPPCQEIRSAHVTSQSPPVTD